MKAHVILFKDTGKYYTEEEWEIPKGAIAPSDMLWSRDFRRISGDGIILIPSQEPWGYPHIFPSSMPGSMNILPEEYYSKPSYLEGGE